MPKWDTRPFRHRALDYANNTVRMTNPSPPPATFLPVKSFLPRRAPLSDLPLRHQKTLRLTPTAPLPWHAETGAPRSSSHAKPARDHTALAYWSKAPQKSPKLPLNAKPYSRRSPLYHSAHGTASPV